MLALNDSKGEIVPSPSPSRQQAGAHLIGWSLETRRAAQQGAAAFYHSRSITIDRDGDTLTCSTVLAKQVGVRAMFSDGRGRRLLCQLAWGSSSGE